jgi:hypothetical protein
MAGEIFCVGKQLEEEPYVACALLVNA